MEEGGKPTGIKSIVRFDEKVKVEEEGKRMDCGVIWAGESESDVCFVVRRWVLRYFHVTNPNIKFALRNMMMDFSHFLTAAPVHIPPLFLLHLPVLYLPIPTYYHVLDIPSISLDTVCMFSHHPIFFFYVS